jgi:hypothetical protein
MRGVCHDLDVGPCEVFGELASHIEAQVCVVCAEDERDRDVDALELSPSDGRVLVVENIEEPSRPRSDGGGCVRLVGVSEELGKDGGDRDPVGRQLVGAEELPGGVLEEPQELCWVSGHGVGERRQLVVGEQADHLRQPQRRRMPEVGVEQDEVGDAFWVFEPIVDRDRTGRIVADQHDALETQRVDHRRQVLRRNGEGVGARRPLGFAVSEEVESDNPPRVEQGCEADIDVMVVGKSVHQDECRLAARAIDNVKSVGTRGLCH